EIWDAGAGRFRPLLCRADAAICSDPGGRDDLRRAFARLRTVLDGVPGVWALRAGDDGKASAVRFGDLQIDTSPGFIDLLRTADGPASAPPPPSPGLALPCALSYRSGWTFGCGIPFEALRDEARATGRDEDPLVPVGAGSVAAGL